MSAFTEYQNALQKFAQKVSEASDAINVNRGKFNAVAAKFEAAVLADGPTQEYEREMTALNAELEILSRRADALNKATGRGSNGFVRDAARKVFAENQAAIRSMQAEWDSKKKALLTMQADYLKLLVELGTIARESSRLREQCVLASTDAGLQIAVPAFGDELQVARRRGWIFPEVSDIALAFTSGELPQQPYAGEVVPGPVKEKIAVADVQPAPPRVPRKPAVPVKATDFEKPGANSTKV